MESLLLLPLPAGQQPSSFYSFRCCWPSNLNISFCFFGCCQLINICLYCYVSTAVGQVTSAFASIINKTTTKLIVKQRYCCQTMIYCIPESDCASQNYKDRNQMCCKFSLSILSYPNHTKCHQQWVNPCAKVSSLMVVIAHQPHYCQTNNFVAPMQTCAMESSLYGTNPKRTILGWKTTHNNKTLTATQ